MPVARLTRLASGQLIWSIREPASPDVVVQASIVPEFDPGAHSVAEVLAYLADHPEDADRVRALEFAGKARKTIVA